MKKVYSTFLSLLVVSFMFSCKPSKQEAISYNDAIINQQIAVVDKINALNDTYQNYVAKDMDMALEKAITQANTSLAAIKKMEKFDGKSTFKDQALDLFKIYKSILELEHTEMIRMYKLPDDKYTPTEMKKAEGLAADANKKMSEGFKKFNMAQSEFAAKYQFEIEKK